MNLLELTNGSMLGAAGVLATITSIIVQVLKNIFPKKFPTRLLTLIVALVVVIGNTLITGPITFGSIVSALFTSFVVAFISMFGFDSVKDIIKKCGGNRGE